MWPLSSTMLDFQKRHREQEWHQRKPFSPCFERLWLKTRRKCFCFHHGLWTGGNVSATPDKGIKFVLALFEKSQKQWFVWANLELLQQSLVAVWCMLGFALPKIKHSAAPALLEQAGHQVSCRPGVAGAGRMPSVPPPRCCWSRRGARGSSVYH
jgi:hypothetical protein